MELGMIGLGRMGANMAERLTKAGHTIVAYDRDAEAVAKTAARGAIGASSLADMVKKLAAPRTLWMMVPSGSPVDDTIQQLVGLLQQNDIIIDGGNSFYKDTMRRCAELKERGIHYVDSGTSGGIWGLKEGYSLMIGGDPEPVNRLRPIFEALAPAPDRGWGRVGPAGAGHFVKMIHNGIEYGMMQAYAEGFAIMRSKSELGLDLHQISEIWQHGSVVRSWLLDLIANALGKDAKLEDVRPWVADSGEGRWTVAEAMDHDVPAPIITLSLLERMRSRDKDSFTDKLLAVMRAEFGGHAVQKESKS